MDLDNLGTGFAIAGLVLTVMILVWAYRSRASDDQQAAWADAADAKKTAAAEARHQRELLAAAREGAQK